MVTFILEAEQLCLDSWSPNPAHVWEQAVLDMQHSQLWSWASYAMIRYEAFPDVEKLNSKVAVSMFAVIWKGYLKLWLDSEAIFIFFCQSLLFLSRSTRFLLTENLHWTVPSWRLFYTGWRRQGRAQTSHQNYGFYLPGLCVSISSGQMSASPLPPARRQESHLRIHWCRWRNGLIELQELTAFRGGERASVPSELWLQTLPRGDVSVCMPAAIRLKLTCLWAV